MKKLLLFLIPIFLLCNEIDFFSKKFLGTPYGFSPLGEGFGVDKDPKIRTDKFDCTTYVETVLAFSKNRNKPLLELDKIRYTGEANFYNRRHFPSQWISGLTKEGYFKDASEEKFKRYKKTISKTIDKEVWEKREPKFLEDFNTSKLPNTTYTLSYISLADLLKIKVTEPLVFSLVREDRENKPIVITHQGFVIPSEKGAVVRHARGKPVSKVIEEPLKDFVERVKSYKSWKVLGLNLLTIN